MTQANTLKLEIEQSGLFDESWYLETYKDVSAVNIDPLAHFIRFGLLMGRDPGPNFNTHFYITRYTDVMKAGVNPLQHYIRYGRAEGRSATVDEESQKDAPIPDEPGVVTAPHSRPADATWDWRLAIDAFMLRGQLP